MTAPKPISLTAGDNPSPAQTPQPFVVVGGIPVPVANVVTALKTLGGYVAGTAQTLQHNTSGVLIWVNNA